MVQKLMTPNCMQYREHGKCMHQAAPRRLFGAAECVLCITVADPRLIRGCALQVEHKRPPAPGVPHIPQPRALR